MTNCDVGVRLILLDAEAESEPGEAAVIWACEEMGSVVRITEGTPLDNIYGGQIFPTHPQHRRGLGRTWTEGGKILSIECGGAGYLT